MILSLSFDPSLFVCVCNALIAVIRCRGVCQRCAKYAFPECLDTIFIAPREHLLNNASCLLSFADSDKKVSIPNHNTMIQLIFHLHPIFGMSCSKTEKTELENRRKLDFNF